ncbi:MAG TPA: aminotransferase class V-fold PLP-dependent enzyme [Candidatus Paceibacterota bacterium]|nr:aminotransferase class V-fold PLP-dependent enzyme [Candidatus Paceibacterota bacterium]
MKKRAYLDWAAAAPVRKEARTAFLDALDAFGNPSSAHEEGRAASALLEGARARVARLAGTKPEAVVFTSGATEANALAIEGRIRARLRLGAPPELLHVLYAPSAHASVTGACMRAEALGVRTEPLSFADGRIDLADLARKVRPETMLVVVDVVCGETGLQTHVRDVRRTLDTALPAGGRINLHADASQAPLIAPFELAQLGADSIALDAQKIGGVRGIGALIALRSVAIDPLMAGGGQERSLRPGTPAPALAAAFAAALSLADRERAAFREHSEAFRSRFLLAIESIAGLSVNEGKEQAPHIVNLSLIGRDTDYVQALLDEAGVAVSTKSACESDSESGSRAVFAYTGDRECAASTLRVSWGPRARTCDLDRCARELVRAVRFVDGSTI